MSHCFLTDPSRYPPPFVEWICIGSGAQRRGSWAPRGCKEGLFILLGNGGGCDAIPPSVFLESGSSLDLDLDGTDLPVEMGVPNLLKLCRFFPSSFLCWIFFACSVTLKSVLKTDLRVEMGVPPPFPTAPTGPCALPGPLEASYLTGSLQNLTTPDAPIELLRLAGQEAAGRHFPSGVFGCFQENVPHFSSRGKMFVNLDFKIPMFFSAIMCLPPFLTYKHLSPPPINPPHNRTLLFPIFF